ncbi:MAG: Wzz/FepE/Etk N-terminal domain-containing protein, partial [Gemmataceae bacterium]|nr:Wzz/FepE/Etk N-terminal domain-containing protein [Gemmataceae bacterium]
MTQRLDLTPEPAPCPPSRGLLRIAWERRLAVAVGALAGALVALAYYLLSTPLYTSSAQILVVRKHPDAVTGGDRLAASEDYVATHQALLKSPLVIERAIKEGRLAGLQSLADARDPTEAILQKLSITRSRDPSGNSNNVLTLAFRGADPDECNRILEALIRAYREVVAETYGRVTDSTVELMARARNELHKELAHKEEAYREFR